MSTRSAFLVRLGFATVAAVCVSSAGRAEEFSWQLAGGMSTDYVAGPGDSDVTSLDATYYLDPVDDAGGPLALASFLSPKSRISVNASRLDGPDISGMLGPTAFTFSNDATAVTVSGRYVLPKSHWYSGGLYSTNDVKNSPFSVTQTSDPEAIGVLGGKYLGANTTLEVTYGSMKQESITPLLCFPPICAFAVETETRTAGIEVFHLWRGTARAWTVSGGIVQSAVDVDVTFPPIVGPATLPGAGVAFLPTIDGPRLRTYRVAGEVFPTARLGVRIGYSRPDGERLLSNDGNYDVAATWFFKPRIGVQFSYGASLADGFADSHAAGIRLIGRL